MVSVTCLRQAIVFNPGQAEQIGRIRWLAVVCKQTTAGEVELPVRDVVGPDSDPITGSARTSL